MSFWNWLRSTLKPDPPTRTTGPPPSGNGASSMHARWLSVPNNATAVEVDLTIIEPPTTHHLHFWALQASFIKGTSTVVGAGHLGLQWIDGYPGRTAVNWGGYATGGGVLDGTESALPGALGNPHTRDFSWAAGSTYRLRIDKGAVGWRGSVLDVATGHTTIIRELHAGGSQLGSVVMWSEIFAPCDWPPSAVQWSNPTVYRAGERSSIEAFSVRQVQLSYQRYEDGGCTNTSTTRVEPGVIEQRTATHRIAHHGAVVDVYGRDSDNT
jgi:hypothetical protein